jgi:uncharacterized membrane protein YadS
MTIGVAAISASDSGRRRRAYGLFAGTAVNDTSSVVATATTYGFVLVAAINSCGIIPPAAHSPSSTPQCSSSPSRCPRSACPALRKAGARPPVLGALLWITVATASHGLQALTGTL